MKTLVSAIVVVVMLTGYGAAAQNPAPAPQGRQAAPPPPPPPPSAPARDPAVESGQLVGQLVNVKIDLAVIEEGGAEPASRKEISVTLADRRSGSVRSGARLPKPEPFQAEAWLNVDARPWLERDGRIRAMIIMQYISPPHFSRNGELKFEPLLESGKVLVASHASSAISDRRMRVEVTATILK